MPTPPFTDSFISRLEDQTQAYRLGCVLGETVSFKFYCCQQPPVLGIVKAPVAVLNTNPDVQCLGQNIAADGLGSWAYPGFSISNINGYSFYWGDGNSNLNTTPGPHNHNYARPGVYTIRLVVTDNQVPAVSGEVSCQVLITDCTNDTVLIKQMYALSATDGPYVKNLEGITPAWVQRIRGLTPEWWQQGRDLKLDPHRKHLRYGMRHVWLATRAGPARSTTDMLLWRQLRDRLNAPRNDAGDPAAPTVADLDFYSIALNPMNRDEVYLLAGTAGRAWVYYSYDSGTTWDNYAVRF